MTIESDSILGSRKLQICPKVTNMGSTIGHRIGHNWGRGSEMSAAHTKQNLPKYGVIAVSFFFRSRAHAM